jgi:hypothetical protein
MVNSAAARPARPAGPDAIEFVRFCYRRKRVGWPELYDEMCAVANRGLFRGFDAEALSGIGIGLCLTDMPGLAAMAAQVAADDQQARRAVAVRIVQDTDQDDRVEEEATDANQGIMPRLVGVPISA